VPRLDFRTSAGFLAGHGTRARSGARGGGPRAVITDFGILTPAAGSEELELSALFEGATLNAARDAVGWQLLVAPNVTTLPPPGVTELTTLRALQLRTREAHRRPVHLPA
jgi:glutaconate CoA-transferase subunit B